MREKECEKDEGKTEYSLYELCMNRLEYVL